MIKGSTMFRTNPLFLYSEWKGKKDLERSGTDIRSGADGIGKGERTNRRIPKNM